MVTDIERGDSASLSAADALGILHTSVWEGNQEAVTRLRPKVETIPFGEYWRDAFVDLATGNYNVTPPAAQYFAQRVHDFAEDHEGEELFGLVAIELGRHFGEYVLKAAIDLPPSPDAVSLPEPELEPLPQALLAMRLAIETSKSITPRVISDSWIDFVQRLASEDSAKYSALSADLMKKLGHTAIEVQSIRAEEAGLLGGFDNFSRDHEISCAIAEVLAQYFPDIVIQGLKPAPRYIFYEPSLGGQLNSPIPEVDLVEINVSPALTE